jgi:predicted ATPase/DNA-binding XRE family transcriptional regulator
MSAELSFGKWLRRRRRALDLTQKALANQVGCAEITVRRMEANAYKPSKELALVLFEKLDIPEPERPQWVLFARGMSHMPTQASPGQKKPNSNLPASLTSFIGREKELADVIRLINRNRLVTLTGSGGVGKTRFAIKVGEQLLKNYSDGIWWIELASLNDPKLLPQATSRLFGLISQPNIPDIDLLINFLRAKSALLILDNCEHLLDACAHLADTLLKNCPDLTILVTSRVPLEIIGEARYRIPSLRIPDLQDQLDNLREFESVKLFEERAQLIRFDFSLTQENASSVAQICYRLNGIPLAIELAAAKAGVLSTVQIAQQLGESLNLLTGGSRTALPRHQTLRASVNWSWSLLTQAEQRLLRQLSVFAGGWSLEAAQSVCDGDVSDLLHSLVTKSLIVMNRGTENNTRYSFHEIIRHYAYEKLEESGESEVVRRRHLDFFLGVALRFEHEVHGAQALNWIKRVSAEHDNLNEAINWAGESGQVQSGLRLGYALHYYWLNYGYWSLGRETLERLLAHTEAAEHTTVRADALNLAGDLATSQGDLEAARALLKESKAIGMELGESGKSSLGWARMLFGQSLMGYDNAMAQHELEQSIILLREAGESWRFAIALLVRGTLAESQGYLMQARTLYSESLEIFQSIGDTWTSALPTMALGRIFYYLSEYATASTYLQRGLEILRAMEGKKFLSSALARLGSIALLQGDDEQAIMHFDERLSITRELMNKEEIAYALCDLGIALKYQGKIVRAMALLREGLELSQKVSNTYPSAACLTGLASITQPARRAAQILAAAQVAFEQSEEFIEPLHRIEHERAGKMASIALGEVAFASAWEEGKQMPLEQVIAYALEGYDE